jgi:hypothetical protein
MRKKNVLCTTVTVDVMGPPNSSAKSIRIAEETVLAALRRLACDFKSNGIEHVNGFLLFLPDDKMPIRKGERRRDRQS